MECRSLCAGNTVFSWIWDAVNYKIHHYFMFLWEITLTIKLWLNAFLSFRMFILHLLEEHRLKRKTEVKWLSYDIPEFYSRSESKFLSDFLTPSCHVGVFPHSLFLYAFKSASDVAFLTRVLYYLLWSFLPSWHSFCMCWCYCFLDRSWKRANLAVLKTWVIWGRRTSPIRALRRPGAAESSAQWFRSPGPSVRRAR